MGEYAHVPVVESEKNKLRRDEPQQHARYRQLLHRLSATFFVTFMKMM